jgi:peroxiredoxin Q/BCP
MPTLKEGSKAPAFSLTADDGKTVKLSDFKGQRVILFFYPRANTPGCTQESCDFRDEIAAFKKRKAVVLGVSRDTPEAQAKFKEKYELPFPLLSDPDHAVHEAYGAWGEKVMYGKKIIGAIRSTAIIGADGKIEKVFPKVKVAGHAQAVLDLIA